MATMGVPETLILDLVFLIGEQLLKIPDEEDRAKVLAGVLDVLACTVDHTDHYGPLVDLARDIRHQAEFNQQALAEDTQRRIEAFRRGQILT